MSQRIGGCNSPIRVINGNPTTLVTVRSPATSAHWSAPGDDSAGFKRTEKRMPSVSGKRTSRNFHLATIAMLARAVGHRRALGSAARGGVSGREHALALHRRERGTSIGEIVD